MDAMIMKYIPRGRHAAILDAYRDSDGYWIRLKDGWHVEAYSAEQTIHEDTISELRKVISRIRRS